MRTPIVFLASLLVFSHVFAADNLIRLSQPLHLEVPFKDTSAKPASADAGKSAVLSSDKEVAKTDTPASAASASSTSSESAAASAPAKETPASGNVDASMSAEEKAQQELAEKIKVRLAAIRARNASKSASAKAMAHVRKVGNVKANSKEKEKTAEAHEESKHWSYDGEDGPSHWGKLNTAWAQCATGKRQSPIDIHDGIKVDLEPIQFEYKPVHYKVTDNGHTIQVDLEPGNHFTLTGHTYELLQFHFHRPSEEHVNGKGFQMVVHLVHKGDDGKLAVVALLVDEGVANSIIQNVWNNLPLEKSDPVVPTGLIDVSQLLPMSREYYTYMGSLTTPPCSEEVLWMVMKQPIKMSAPQIAIFARLYPMNARPIQPNEARIIKESN
ncbi:MAG TPA: carbonic anhydrase family protein [Burkholderiaceae bacterium]|jgi:carbonic anhydrase